MTSRRLAILAALCGSACAPRCRAPESKGICVVGLDGGGCEWIHALELEDGSAECPQELGPPQLRFDAGACPFEPRDELSCG